MKGIDDDDLLDADLSDALIGSAVPEHDWDGIVAYVAEGRPAGSFLTAVFENDLMEACMFADDLNQHAVFDIADILYNCTPSACHGSRQRVEKWQEHRGLKGRESEEEAV